MLRRNLETLLTHMKAEMAGDVDGLLVTLSDDVHVPRLRQRRSGHQPGRARQVRAFYNRFIGSGAGQLQLDIDRLVVDKDCILTEGVMRIAYPGRTLQAMGIDVDDGDAYYLYEAWMATLWPFDENGLATGEDTYTGGDGFAGIADRKLAPDDIVQYAPPAEIR